MLLLPCLLQAQVIFSRRVYAEHGRSYQQLWSWNASGGGLKPLTRSPRDHSQPVCSRDGKRILFVSGATGVWSFDRATGAEREIWKTPGAISLQLIGIARDGAPLVEKESAVQRTIISRLYKGGARPLEFAGNSEESALSPDGLHLVRSAESTDPASEPAAAYVTDTATGRSHVSIGKCGDVAWSPDGKSIACSAGFVTDAATGKSRVAIARCEFPSWSPEGTRIACVSGDDIILIDAASKKETGRIQLPEIPLPHHADGLGWSPNGEELLLELYGKNANSTFPQSDYLVLDVAAKKWTGAGTGNHAIWLPGRDLIAYSTPRDLVPLGSLSVWSAQLAVFDLANGKQQVLTSGVADNENPVACGR
jgi:hypothetical protein